MNLPTQNNHGDDDSGDELAPSAQSAQSASPSDVLAPGERLGKYRIKRLLGQNEFSAVYLAIDPNLERRFAVREYFPRALAERGEGGALAVRDHASVDAFAGGLQAFLEDARLLSEFDHPSIARVRRIWEENNTGYMAMPFYKGPTLQTLRKEMARPPDEDWLFERLLMPLLGALEQVHAASAVHGKVSPGNIVMLPDRRTILVDIASPRRWTGETTPSTTAPDPAYAPIEQFAKGAQKTTGPWSDVYSLAAVACYAITGVAPPSAQVRATHTLASASDAVRETAERFADLQYSDTFLDALDAAFSVQRRERLPSAQAFRKALTRGLASTDEDAAPVTGDEPDADDPDADATDADATAASAPEAEAPAEATHEPVIEEVRERPQAEVPAKREIPVMIDVLDLGSADTVPLRHGLRPKAEPETESGIEPKAEPASAASFSSERTSEPFTRTPGRTPALWPPASPVPPQAPATASSLPVRVAAALSGSSRPPPPVAAMAPTARSDAPRWMPQAPPAIEPVSKPVVAAAPNAPAMPRVAPTIAPAAPTVVSVTLAAPQVTPAAPPIMPTVAPVVSQGNVAPPPSLISAGDGRRSAAALGRSAATPMAPTSAPEAPQREKRGWVSALLMLAAIVVVAVSARLLLPHLLEDPGSDYKPAPNAATEATAPAAGLPVPAPSAPQLAGSAAAAVAGSGAVEPAAVAPKATAQTPPAANAVATPAPAVAAMTPAVQPQRAAEPPPAAIEPPAPAPVANDKGKTPSQRERPVAVQPAAPDNPRAGCSGRTNFSLYYCMQKQCKEPQFVKHPQCKLLRERDIVE